MRILMTGGGTAGHVNPALAIAATIKAHHPDAEIAFAASAMPTDKARDLVPRAGYPLRTIHIQGLARPLWTPSNIKLPIIMAEAKREADRLIEEFRPDLIVGTGGFACWPVCHMGIKRGIPTALHESNALPGKAIMRLKGHANAVLVNFPETAERIGIRNAVHVGNPIMPGFSTLSREEARQKLGLSDKDFFILSFGGSGGAEYVNDAVVSLAATLADDRRCNHVRLLHAAGKRDAERSHHAWSRAGLDALPRFTLADYIYDMPVQMAAADLVISRAGAMSLSELSLMGKAAILIPSPYVAEQHQLKNAMALVAGDAAVCVEEHTLPGGTLVSAVRALLDDPDRRAAMEGNIRTFARPDSNERIYETLMSIL